MAETDFVPIKMTGCDEERVKKASSNKKQYVFPFMLSAKPPRPWGRGLMTPGNRFAKNRTLLLKLVRM